MEDNVSKIDREHKVSTVNVPNALTLLRLLLVPVLIVLMVAEGGIARWCALIVFVVAAATDQLDGHIARARNLVTDFGRIVDPIADKTLTLSAFAMLSVQGLLSWWVTILIAVRELGITALRAVLLRREIVVSANKGGKFKTVLQMIAIVVLLVPWGTFLPEALALGCLYVGWFVAGMALIVTIWSGAVYVVEGVRLWRQTPKES